jgi:hypothetical protein
MDASLMNFVVRKFWNLKFLNKWKTHDESYFHNPLHCHMVVWESLELPMAMLIIMPNDSLMHNIPKQPPKPHKTIH